ncbi:hypothetical protein MMC09_005518 [Bachmanniomyces sp. S44760]|nr:hypothetical protein [Bachmanniomyces sp. S44760]
MVYYFTSTADNINSNQPVTIYVGKDKFEKKKKKKTEKDPIFTANDDDQGTFLQPSRPRSRLPVRLLQSNSPQEHLNTINATPHNFHVNGKHKEFHADNLSSAHVYLRLNEGQTWDDIPAALVEECAQLTKANSIEGNKKDNVTVIYTPWSNLRKDGSMAVGQVGFHDPKKTARTHLPTRSNPLINKLAKTRTEIPPPQSTAHLESAREEHLATKRKLANADAKKKYKDEERKRREAREVREREEREWEDLNGARRVEEEGKSNLEDGGWDEDDFM